MPQPPENAIAPNFPGGALPQALGKTDEKINSPISKTLQAGSPEIVALIEKTPACQIRIQLTCWRGQKKIELREATSQIPGIYFPTSAGISLDIGKIPELIKALERARARAVSLGLLSNGRAT